MSAGEIAYTLQGAAADMREDGRARLDFRHLSLEVGLLPQTSGSARLRIGGTEVLVGVVAVLAEPPATTPDMGRLVVAVGCGPGGDAAVAAGLPEYTSTGGGSLGSSSTASSQAQHSLLEDKRVWLEGALAQLYGPTTMGGPLRALCIAPGRQCWELRVHVQLIRADGCPLDAASLAIRAALHATRVPRVAVAATASEAASEATSGQQQPAQPQQALDLDLDESLDESLPFDAAAVPVYVTLASLGGHLVADCTAKERKAAGAALSLALDADGQVAALCGGGGYGLHLAAVATAMALAQQLCSALHAAAAVAIKQACDVAEMRATGGAAGVMDGGFAGPAWI